jgi:hypothetical protein
MNFMSEEERRFVLEVLDLVRFAGCSLPTDIVEFNMQHN